MKNEYPNLHDIAMSFLLCFSTTYLCETAFSAITLLKTKQRNRPQLSVCLRLAITSIHPTVNKLTENQQNLTSLTKTFKSSVVIKENEFNFFSNL
jgi:hypothetical protein